MRHKRIAISTDLDTPKQTPFENQLWFEIFNECALAAARGDTLAAAFFSNPRSHFWIIAPMLGLDAKLVSQRVLATVGTLAKPKPAPKPKKQQPAPASEQGWTNSLPTTGVQDAATV